MGDTGKNSFHVTPLSPYTLHTTCYLHLIFYIDLIYTLGDCFNAAAILCLARGFSIPDTLNCACQVAGECDYMIG